MSDFTEDCCFNAIRDHCPKNGCKCGCHVVYPEASTSETERLTNEIRALRSEYLYLSQRADDFATALSEALDALKALVPFAEEHVRLSYRDADVPQMLADPILKRARAVLEG